MEEVQETSGYWFREEVTPDFAVSMRLENMEPAVKSDFQTVQIINTKQFGRTLVLDHKTQSAEKDEHIYHETLVHAAMLAHPNPKTVYIGGGGEMATAREILKHSSVEKVVMVDIDRVVCDFALTHLKQWSEGVGEDPRFELHCEDANAFIRQDPRTWDVIIMDIADPIEAGPGIALYTRDFYKFAATRLSESGVLVTQSGPGSQFNVGNECCSTIHRTLRSVFDHVHCFSADIPSFGSNWGFNLAHGCTAIAADPDSDDVATAAGAAPVADAVAADCKDMLTQLSIDERNALIEARITGGAASLKFYDGITHLGLFGLPLEVRAALWTEERIMSMENPVFMH